MPRALKRSILRTKETLRAKAVAFAGSILAACTSAPPDPATHLPRQRPAECALTFDDGPGLHTIELLDILRSRQISATFFVLGEQVRREPEVVRRMAAEGHEVENHSFDHPNLRHLSPAAQQQEIDATQSALRSLGIEPKFFRPPYGSYDAETVRAAGRDGLILVLWTKDGKDWKYHTVRGLYGYAERSLEPNVGGIYLFHDIHSWTVSAMPEILDGLSAAGCRFVTVAQYVAAHPAPASPD